MNVDSEGGLRYTLFSDKRKKVTVHTGVNSKDIATLNGTRKRRAIDNGTKED